MKKGETKLLYRSCPKLTTYVALLASIISLIIALFILFYPPMPGVSDQGDFQRVMSVTGLEEIAPNTNDYNIHWFKYVTTKYKIIPINFERVVGIIPTTSMIYPVSLVRLICNLTKSHYFNTRVLALFYTFMYISSLYLCLRWVNFKKVGTYIFFTILCIFMLMDGNYLVWFNSLYGEPMMIVSLLFFNATVIYVSKHLEESNSRGILLVFTAAFLFLGSKLQCFVALPFIVLLIIHIALFRNIRTNFFKASGSLVLPTMMLIFYVHGIYVQLGNSCGLDTKYNSVFYGILKNSQTPEKDLAVLGLPADMAVEKGKHAYLPKNQYEKYAPGSDLVKNEFNTRISNFKLMEFYLFQPKRLIKGLEYTASKCFDTGSFLGKYEKSDTAKYTFTFKRFTLWSDFRNSKLPKKLTFLVVFYAIVISVSIIEYIKKKADKSTLLCIELLWLNIIIGLLQFPMPYIGNGEADTSKQLFLFNYTFDIALLVACTWFFDKLYKPRKSI